MERRTGQKIGEQTLLTYEHGTREITVQRLMDLSITYGVPYIVIITRVMERLEAKHKCGTCGQRWPENRVTPS